MGKIQSYIFKHTSFIVVSVLLILSGIITRNSYGDVFKNYSNKNDIVVGILPDGVVSENLTELRKILPFSNYILKVRVLSNPIAYNYIYGYNVMVEKVYKGEDISRGDVFFMTRTGWTTFLNTGTKYNDVYQYINLGFVNFLENQGEYLVFLEEKVDTLDNTLVYKLYDYIVAPVFNYRDGNSTPHDSIISDGYFIEYNEVSNDEFICESQQVIDEMIYLKKELINEYR